MTEGVRGDSGHLNTGIDGVEMSSMVPEAMSINKNGADNGERVKFDRKFVPRKMSWDWLLPLIERNYSS